MKRQYTICINHNKLVADENLYFTSDKNLCCPANDKCELIKVVAADDLRQEWRCPLPEHYQGIIFTANAGPICGHTAMHGSEICGMRAVLTIPWM